MFGPIAKVTILLAYVAGARAQSVASCDGFQQPDWDDCTKIADLFADLVGEVENNYPGCTSMRAYIDGTEPNDLNCDIRVCPASADVRVLWGEARIGYSTVEAVCKGDGAGGTDVYEDQFSVEVFNNVDYDPSTLRVANETELDDTETKEAIERRHQRDFTTKRQQPDDDSFELLAVSQRVRKAGTEVAITGRLTAGSDRTTTESDSVTTGVSGSAELSASFFTLFEASVSGEVSQDQTSTSAVGITVIVDCESGQEGIIYYYPLFTKYSGRFQPSGDYIDIWVPDDSAVGTSNYGVTCLD